MIEKGKTRFKNKEEIEIEANKQLIDTMFKVSDDK